MFVGGAMVPSILQIGSIGTSYFANASTNGAGFSNTLVGDTWIRANLNNTVKNLRMGTSVGGASSLDILASGDVIINSATTSLSSTSGAFQVVGGVGIGGKLYVAGGIQPRSAQGMIFGSDAFNNLRFTAGTGVWNIFNETGAAIFRVANSITASPSVSVLSATGSTSSGTGALVVTGGVGIGENLYAGHTFVNYSGTILPPLNFTKSGLNVVCDSSNGGSVISAAEPVLNLVRLGVTNQAWDNHATFYLSRYENAGSAARTQLDISLTHDTVTAGSDVNIKVLRLRSDGSIMVPSATDADSATSGALQVIGGVGIGKSLYVGGYGLFKTAKGSSDYSILGTQNADGGENTRIILSGSTRVANQGNIEYLTAGSVGAHYFKNGVVAIGNATDTFSSTSGALQVAVGAAIFRTLSVGGGKACPAGILKLNTLTTNINDKWWIGFCHGNTDSSDTNDRARIGCDVDAAGNGRLFFSTGWGNTQLTHFFIDGNGYMTYSNGSVTARNEVNGLTTCFQNTNAGSSAYNIIQLQNDQANGVIFFINSTTRSGDGGVNTATIRNDIGSLRLQASNAQGIVISPAGIVANQQITANAGLQVPSGQSLRADGVFVMGGTATVSIDYPNVAGGRFSIDANGNVNIARGNLSVSGLVSSTTFPGAPFQGAHIGWNRGNSSGYNGQTVFANHQGLGSGGWEFINYNASSVFTNVAMYLSAAGALTTTLGVTSASITLAGTTSGTIKFTPAATTTTYNLTLPPSLPSKSNQALLTSAAGVTKWGDVGGETVNNYSCPSNVVATPTAVTNLVANSLYLIKDVYVSTVGSGGASPTLYNLRAFKTSTGYSELSVQASYDDTTGSAGVTFSIDAAGQVYFVKPSSTTGWVSTTISWITPSLQ